MIFSFWGELMQNMFSYRYKANELFFSFIPFTILFFHFLFFFFLIFFLNFRIFFSLTNFRMFLFFLLFDFDFINFVIWFFFNYRWLHIWINQANLFLAKLRFSDAFFTQNKVTFIYTCTMNIPDDFSTSHTKHNIGLYFCSLVFDTNEATFFSVEKVIVDLGIKLATTFEATIF